MLLLLATVLQALLWFNPAARWLARKLAWAQELGCDRQVLAGRPQRQRQQYAAALVSQLGLQAQSRRLAFGGSSGMAERVTRMRETARRPHPWSECPPGWRCALGVASVALQPALAWTVGAVPEPMAAPATLPV